MLETSVQYDLHAGYNNEFSTSNYFQTWMPFVTAINMNGTGGTNDCIAYINKLTNMAGFSQTLFISAPPTYYGSPNWYFDDAQGLYPSTPIGLEAAEGVSNAISNPDVTYTPFTDNTHITKGTNVVGYFTWGTSGQLPATYAIDGTISFFGSSTWYLIATGESYNGQRVPAEPQGNFLNWYSFGAFGATNYLNTPVGAISHVDEPHAYADNSYNYFGLWASGKSFAISAWGGQVGTYPLQGESDYWFQATGDPFVNK
jgi:hypothetical protein